MKVKVKFVAKSLSVVIVHISLSQTMDSYGNNQCSGYIRMPVRALAERLPPHPRVAANFPRIPSAPPGFFPLPAHPPVTTLKGCSNGKKKLLQRLKVVTINCYSV